jgi:hypothetical protein
MNSMRILIAWAVLAGVILIALVTMLILYLRRRRRGRMLRAAEQG